MTAQPATPPWGDDFDAQRAWSLVTSLRAEIAEEKTAHGQTKAERDRLATERDDLTTEKTAAEEAAAEAATALTAATEATTAAQRDLWVERAVRMHGIDEDLVDFLTGDDEETILAKAERLAGRNKPADKLPGLPVPALIPGHSGDSPGPFDADSVVDYARA